MQNKVKTIIFASLSAVLALGVALAVFFLINASSKLSTPTNLAVIDNLPNGEVVLQVDKNEQAIKYAFVVSRGGKSNTLISNVNYIDASAFIEEAGEYQIKCRVVGKTKASLSAFSASKTYICNNRLGTPETELSELENRLYFTEVQNAESYELIYGTNDNGELLKLYSYVGQSGKKYFDLSSLSGGEYNLFVIAKASNYRNSKLSDPIVFRKIEKLQSPTEPNYTNGILSFESNSNYFEVVISYSDNEDKVLKIHSLGNEHHINIIEHHKTTITKVKITALGNDKLFTVNSDAVTIEV